MTESLRFGRFEVRAAARQLLVDGRVAALGARAFDLLLALIERRDRVVGKNELLDLVWPGLVVEENNLQVQVSSLRKLLGTQVIGTIPGRGYRFVAAIYADAERDTAAPAPPAPAGPGNLPLQRGELIGRDADLTALLALMERQPLVTVVGAGGIGKTTLALAAADALRGRFSYGAWLVDLAPIADPALLPQTIAQTLRITLGGSGSAQERLVDVLASQSLLLLLDNCERQVAAAGALAAAVTARAAKVRILVTSQELLNVPGERLYRLGPLSLPLPDEAPAAQHGAVRLFVERARAVDPRFELTPHNAAAVAELCRSLDGLPLAIELAAARVRLLGVPGVLDRLGERFRILAGGARTALPRHQALHATLDWSHALLSPPEQAVLRRLGVFVGGFPLPLAQQVAADAQLDEWAVLDALGGLVDKSLVAAEGGEPLRYRLLETTRAYALERLAEHGEAEAMRQRHAQAVAAYFFDADEARFGESGTLSMAEFLQRTVPELDNLRAALEWTAGAPDRRPLAIALAAGGGEVFRQLGLSQEAIRRMAALWPLADGEVPAATIALFCARYGSLGNNGRLPHTVIREAEARAESIYRQRGDRRRLHFSLYGKAWSLNLFGDSDAAAATLGEMQALEQPSWPVWLRASRLNVLATLHLFADRYDTALEVGLEQQRLLAAAAGEESLLTTCQSNLCNFLSCLQRCDEAIAVARSVIERNGVRRDRNIDYATWHLMAAQLFLGHLDDATATMHQALAGWRRDGLLQYLCFGLALLLAMGGRSEDAARLEGAALAFYRRAGVRLGPIVVRLRTLLRQHYEAAALDDRLVAARRREGELLDDTAIESLCRRLEAAKPAAAGP